MDDDNDLAINQEVFAKLDRDASGKVTLDDLHGNFL